MVIVHVILGFTQGGVSSVVKNLLLAQAKANMRLAVVTKKEDCKTVRDWSETHNIQLSVYATKQRNVKHPSLTGYLDKNLMREIQQDNMGEEVIFHFHNPASYGLFGRCNNAICTLHGINVTESCISNSIFDNTIRKILHSGGEVIGCCQAVTNYYNKKLLENRIQSVQNGTFKCENRKPCFDKNYQKITIGYASYIDELKGWRILAEAYLQLSQQEKEKIEIIFAGGIAPSEKDDFQTFVKTNQVRYLGFIKNTASDFMPYVDYFALPSRSEGMPMTILESLQAGTPVLATPVGGIPEVIESGKNGYLIDRSVEAWKKMLLTLIENTKLKDVLRSGAKETYEKHFTNSIMEQNYMRAYLKLIKGKK